MGGLIVFLHDQEQSLISIKEHLVLFDIDIFRGNGVFAQICPN